ncbi:hypothetical protein INR49_014154 [Caranx melampygus]|nr:hypothetical protein INR49_014154 [Caranx melampygus]
MGHFRLFEYHLRILFQSILVRVTGSCLRKALKVVSDMGRITGISPRPEGCLTLMGLRVACLFPQVVKLEGDFIVRVKEATITQVSMLRYQDLQHDAGGGSSRYKPQQRRRETTSATDRGRQFKDA